MQVACWGDAVQRYQKRIPITKAEANGHQRYEKEKKVTWWGFTSTTTDKEVTNTFIEKAPQSTFFNIRGKDLWGYNLAPFSKIPRRV